MRMAGGTMEVVLLKDGQFIAKMGNLGIVVCAACQMLRLLANVPEAPRPGNSFEAGWNSDSLLFCAAGILGL
jgi:hypothetical protein